LSNESAPLLNLEVHPVTANSRKAHRRLVRRAPTPPKPLASPWAAYYDLVQALLRYKATAASDFQAAGIDDSLVGLNLLKIHLEKLRVLPVAEPGKLEALEEIEE